jgi:histidinol phosphate phosphatase hisN-like protein
VARARNRPPRLLPRVGEVTPAPTATRAQLLERAKVAGAAGGPGPTELRRFVERIVAGDRAALGELAPIAELTMLDAWAAFTEVFGATPERAEIDPEHTLRAAHAALHRICTASEAGSRIAFATSAPASLLGLHAAIGRLAAGAGAEVSELADVGPLRVDGRSPRWLRWIEGVAVVTDGLALCPTRDGEAAREWLFVHPRPALVVADGPFAEVAWEAGIEVVAFASLDRGALAIHGARGDRCTVVPMRTDRPPRAYAPVVDTFVTRVPPGDC